VQPLLAKQQSGPLSWGAGPGDGMAAKKAKDLTALSFVKNAKEAAKLTELDLTSKGFSAILGFEQGTPFANLEVSAEEAGRMSSELGGGACKDCMYAVSKVLRLPGNDITALVGLEGLVVLHELDSSSNLIETLEGSCLNQLPNLERLSLANNRLQVRPHLWSNVPHFCLELLLRETAKALEYSERSHGNTAHT
jgi:Leucine-rich repeat (LRR) protein